MTAIVARLAALLSAATLTLGVLGGCGESSKPLTRAELIAKADAICRRVTHQVDWLKVTKQSLSGSVHRLAALEEQAAGELSKLIPPPSMAEAWHFIVNGFRLTGPQFEQIARAAREVVGSYAIPLSNAQHERALRAKLEGITGCEEY